MDKVLKKQPAMIIGLSECQAESEDVLIRDPRPAAVAAAARPGAKGEFKYRPEFKYLTLRGKEKSSVLIAVRDQAGCALEMLDLERKSHGLMKRKNNTSTRRGIAYSRSMIAKVTLPQNVGFIGK